MPEVIVSRCLTVIPLWVSWASGGTRFSRIFTARSSGDSFPSSISIPIAVAVTDLLSECSACQKQDLYAPNSASQMTLPFFTMKTPCISRLFSAFSSEMKSAIYPGSTPSSSGRTRGKG